MSHSALAHMVGTHPGEIGRFERGERKPQRKTQERLCTALGCRLSDLWEQT